jgi:hypothetical protein
MRDDSFLEIKEEFKKNKTVLENTKAEFEDYIKELLNPDTKLNRIKPIHHFSESIENISL